MFQHHFPCPATILYPPPPTSLLWKKLKGCAGDFAASRAAFSFSVDQNCWSGPGCAANTALKAQVRAPRLCYHSPCGRYSAWRRGTDQPEQYSREGQGRVSVKLGANWQPSSCRQLFVVIFGVNFGGALEFKPHILSLIIGLRGMGPRHPWARTLSSETALCWLPQPALPISWVHPLPTGEQEPCHPISTVWDLPLVGWRRPPPNGAPWSSDSGSRAPRPEEALFSKGMVQNQAPAPKSWAHPTPVLPCLSSRQCGQPPGWPGMS